MISMAGIGILLILGVMTRLAAIAGIVWMVLFYTASAIWPENNPFLDDHIVYVIVLAGIAYVGAGRYLGLGDAGSARPSHAGSRCFVDECDLQAGRAVRCPRGARVPPGSPTDPHLGRDSGRG